LVIYSHPWSKQRLAASNLAPPQRIGAKRDPSRTAQIPRGGQYAGQGRWVRMPNAQGAKDGATP
jgi:hypothetical protein